VFHLRLAIIFCVSTVYATQHCPQSYIPVLWFNLLRALRTNKTDVLGCVFFLLYVFNTDVKYTAVM